MTKFKRFAILVSIAVSLSVFVFAVFLGSVVYKNANPFFDSGTLYFVLLAAVFCVALGVLSFVLMMFYPKLKTAERARRIEASMYDTVNYLYTVTKSGADMYSAIKSVSKYPDRFGDAAGELASAVFETEFCGSDVYTALIRLAKSTPCDKFGVFLFEYVSTCRSIGDAELFLKDKAEEMHEEHRMKQKTYLAFLSSAAEIYITLFVAGPLFFMIAITVLSMISELDSSMLALFVYVLLPLGTAAFIVFLNLLPGASNPESIKPARSKKQKRIENRAVKKNTDARFRNLYRALKRYDDLKKFRDFAAHPIKSMICKPLLSFVFAVPASVFVCFVYAACRVFSTGNFFEYGADVVELVGELDDFVVIFLIAFAAPYAVFYHLNKLRQRKVEEAVFDFSRQLGSYARHNMTLAKAIRTAAKDEESYIKSDIRMLSREIEWGASVSSALHNFSERLRSDVAVRSVVLISEARHFSSDVSSVLFSVYLRSKEALMLKKERESNMALYIVIVYLAFFVFVFVQVIMSGVFVDSAAVTQGFSAEFYGLVAVHSVLIHGVCSGICAGVLGEGDARAGVKHACVLLALGYVLYYAGRVCLEAVGLF